VKGATLYAPSDPVARDKTLNLVIHPIDHALLDFTEWHINVTIKISKPFLSLKLHTNNCSSLASLVQPSLRSLDCHGPLLFHKDKVAQLVEVAGFCAHSRNHRISSGVSYMNVYTTDKTNTYQPQLGISKRKSAKSLRSNYL
ncbi:hypothetical protein B0H21DRAFT_677203, partial [Amylocystis lapponica]